MAKNGDKFTKKLLIDPSGQLDLVDKSYQQEVR